MAGDSEYTNNKGTTSKPMVVMLPHHSAAK
jgi:hypothetical protein